MGHNQRRENVCPNREVTHCSIYDGIFQAWDGLGKGAIGGDTAIEVFSQSGLPRGDLERIW
jgi:hypothetical protein